MHNVPKWSDTLTINLLTFAARFLRCTIPFWSIVDERAKASTHFEYISTMFTVNFPMVIKIASGGEGVT